MHAVPCNRTSAAATQSLVLSSSSVAMSIVNLLGMGWTWVVGRQLINGKSLLLSYIYTPKKIPIAVVLPPYSVKSTA
jgi:ABC-type sulfate transport system permease subunit